MIRLTVPGRARPSVRITGRSKWSAAARGYLDWQKTVATACMGCKPLTGVLKLTMTFYIATKKRGDLTNLCKSTEDGLQYGGLIPNDKYVMEMHARIEYVEDLRDERVEIEVEVIG